MPSPSSFPPIYNDEAQEASANLRLVLPLVNKHKTPVNPVNYAIWYEYVSGNNQELTDSIDKHLVKNEAITPELTQKLYEKYVLMDMPDRLEKTNGDLKMVINNTLENFTKAEVTTGDFISSLDNSQLALTSCATTDELKTLITDLLSTTQAMADTGKELKQDLTKSSQEIDHLKEELAAVKKLAETDALTGLLNRGAFNKKLSTLCQQPGSVDAVLLFFDLDNFKRVNDTFGHLVGDKVIQYFSSLLTKYTDEQHLAFRYGGEEMATIMLNSSQRDALSVAEKIRTEFADSRLKKKGSNDSIGQITVSVGLSTLRSSDSPDDLIERADDALYLSKENGRNRISAR